MNAGNNCIKNIYTLKNIYTENRLVVAKREGEKERDGWGLWR